MNPRPPSLQLRLFVLLTLAITLAAAVSGILSYLAVYEEVQEYQDGMLRQAAQLRPSSPDGGSESDEDTPIRVLPFQAASAYSFPADAAEGFYNVTDRQGKAYRAYLSDSGSGKTAYIQESEFRSDTAAESAYYATLPQLIAVPVTLLLTALTVYFTLRPLRRLSRNIATRSDHDLSPLDAHNIPTEIGGLIHAVNRLFSRVEADIAQRRRFIADAAHELRSPLTALSLQAEQLNAYPLDGQARALAAQLQQGISRNRNLLEQLLTLARAESDHGRTLSEVNLAAVCKTVLEDLYPLAQAKNLDLGSDGLPDYLIAADETEIYTLVKNLVGNAVRYTPEGGSIDIRLLPRADGCSIQIEDSGAGISEAERSRVFDPFYRILGSRTEGSGLGLSIAQTLAARYGGRITLADAVKYPGGLLAEIWLPKT